MKAKELLQAEFDFNCYVEVVTLDKEQNEVPLTGTIWGGHAKSMKAPWFDWNVSYITIREDRGSAVIHIEVREDYK